MKFLVASAIAILILMSGFFAFTSRNATFFVSEETILIDDVKHGELNITVRGTGVLVPKDIRWVATDVDGRIERIFIKPGTKVATGDVIMNLSNPYLNQKLEDIKWDLETLKYENTSAVMSLESAILDQEASVMNEKLNYERTLLTFNAHKKLQSQGVVAVSKVAHAEVKIDVAQYQERWRFEEKRLEKIQANVQAQKQANTAKLKRMQRRLQRIEIQVESLRIKATMDSTVQLMPVEEGQQISPGTNLARLAKTDAFIAELRIPEKQIQSIALGQKVTIDTRNNKIEGVVQRIDPTVENGGVQIDITLLGKLPDEVRSDLTVDGIIQIAKIPDTLFIKRPMFVKDNRQSSVYVLEENGEFANKRIVEFGNMSSQYIQIKEGLQVGQKVIVSDISSWESHEKISIN